MKEENLVYKVVGKGHRYGSNMTIFLISHKNLKEWKKWNLELWKKVKIYFPRYFKGHIIKEVKGSAGILCFKNLRSAHMFLREEELINVAKIIKVRGIGKPKEIISIKSGCGGQILRLLDSDLSISMNGYYGSIAFKSVEVLE